MLKKQDIAKMIDHSLLNPKYTDEDIIQGCRLARAYDTATVCVRPTDLPIAVKELEGSNVLVTTVIGFPHGSNTTEAKVFEAKQAIEMGAVELDMVLNIGKLLSKEYTFVKNDIEAVVKEAHQKGVIVKVILENCYLTDELKIKACEICEAAGADFVKTSTGYGTGGATAEDLKLMRESCSEKIHIKAAGGVRTLEAALVVRKIGGIRFGATTTQAILDEAEIKEKNGKLEELPDDYVLKI